MSFSALIPIITLIIQIVYEVYSQEKANPESGQGAVKKKNLLNNILSAIERAFGGVDTDDVNWAGGMADKIVWIANKLGIFKTSKPTTDFDTTPGGDK